LNWLRMVFVLKKRIIFCIGFWICIIGIWKWNFRFFIWYQTTTVSETIRVFLDRLLDVLIVENSTAFKCLNRLIIILFFTLLLYMNIKAVLFWFLLDLFKIVDFFFHYSLRTLNLKFFLRYLKRFSFIKLLLCFFLILISFIFLNNKFGMQSKKNLFIKYLRSCLFLLILIILFLFRYFFLFNFHFFSYEIWFRPIFNWKINLDHSYFLFLLWQLFIIMKL